MMLQSTLVSLYGEKPESLGTLITKCQELVLRRAGKAFTPYETRQIHATIFGLERKVGSENLNLNFWRCRGREVRMDFDGLARPEDAVECSLSLRVESSAHYAKAVVSVLEGWWNAGTGRASAYFDLVAPGAAAGGAPLTGFWSLRVTLG